MYTPNIALKIKHLMQIIHPNTNRSFEVITLPKHEALDMFFFERILSKNLDSIDHNLTLEQLREFSAYPCFMVKKNTYGPNESKAILFNKFGQTIGEFTLTNSFNLTNNEAEIINYLAA